MKLSNFVLNMPVLVAILSNANTSAVERFFELIVDHWTWFPKSLFLVNPELLKVAAVLKLLPSFPLILFPQQLFSFFLLLFLHFLHLLHFHFIWQLNTSNI